MQTSYYKKETSMSKYIIPAAMLCTTLLLGQNTYAILFERVEFAKLSEEQKITLEIRNDLTKEFNFPAKG